MTRQKLDNGTWFDLDKATKYEEDRWWNGNNHISKATGTQWDHEALYRTARGAFVLHWWSQWQGSRDRWHMIEKEDAYAWLIKNNHDNAVPKSTLSQAEV